MPAGDITLTAKWTRNRTGRSGPLPAPARVYSNNGSPVIELEPVPVGDPIKLPEDPSWKGHTFKGWFLDAALTKPFPAGMIMPAGGVDIYAKWSINDAPSKNAYIVKTKTSTITKWDHKFKKTRYSYKLKFSTKSNSYKLRYVTESKGAKVYVKVGKSGKYKLAPVKTLSIKRGKHQHVYFKVKAADGKTTRTYSYTVNHVRKK